MIESPLTRSIEDRVKGDFVPYQGLVSTKATVSSKTKTYNFAVIAYKIIP